MALPKQYAWLAKEPGPKMLVEAAKMHGTLEKPGTADNPVIEAWADEVKKAFPGKYVNWAADWYNSDSIPWCGLFVAVCSARAGREPAKNYLSALAWAGWGNAVPKEQAALGDVLVFVRKGGGHVALYCGEDATHYHILGGNQSDKVSIVRRPKTPIYAVRRPIYISFKPRKVRLAAKGQLAGSEA